MEAVLKHGHTHCPGCDTELKNTDEQFCWWCGTDLYKTNPCCRECGQRKDSESKLRSLQKRVCGYIKAARPG